MDVDDEFGDLYADIGPETGKKPSAEPLVEDRVGDGDLYDEDDEELLYGTSASAAPAALPSKQQLPSLLSSVASRSVMQLGLAAKEVDNEELLLYGQLYGDASEASVQAGGRPVETTKPIAVSASVRADVGETAKEGRFDLSVEERSNRETLPEEIPLGGARMGLGNGERTMEKDGVVAATRIVDGFGGRGLPLDGDSMSNRRLPLASVEQMNSPPGLSGTSGRVQTPEYVIEDEEEEEEVQEMVEEWGEGGVIEGGDEEGGLEVQGEGEDWDSDSEDDIQIVLNEEVPLYPGERQGDEDEVEGSEDEEDLVIVTGDDDALPIEEQEWEELPLAMDALPGAAGPGNPLGSERVVGGEDRGPGAKGSGGSGTSPGVPRIGYSGQGYHAHHMQYKYVRPGAGSGATSGTALPPNQGSPQGGASTGRGTSSASGGGWGPGRGAGGRGDWSSGGGRGAAGQRQGQGPGSMASWGGSRGFPSGMEFNLPPTKTVFDVDLDSLEEKPWRRPGVDITDYFNFSFTESSWRQYCRQLAQLRLEATMQSKIRVYESGRSEQDYDPDLPPELAAAAGMQEASGDPNSQQRQQDGGMGAGRGRVVARARMMPPTGRAIQVEGGGGERRPSTDIRRQRARDSDAIVLQDASEEDRPPPLPVNEGNEEFLEEDEDRGGAAQEKDRRFFRPGGPPPWEMDGPPNMWERENMPMGPGPMPNMGPHGVGMMPGHRMDMDGPGPFPVGPGMPMHQPGPGPNFGMFPGAPFGLPPGGRGGMLRPPLYSGPRPGLPLPVPGPPPDGFPPMMLPLDYHDTGRRRTPPHLSPPRRTPPQGLPGDWDDELSNGSGANWNTRDSRRESKEFDAGNGDWPTDNMERRESSYPVRRGREPDRTVLRERSVDEASVDVRSEDHKRSISRERHLEDSDWDAGYSRNAKKQRILTQVDARVKSVREEYSHSKVLKSNARKEEPSHSWELSKERVAPEEEISQQKRRFEGSHSKAGEWKGPLAGEDSVSSQRKDPTWNDREDEDSKEQRQPRDREGVQRKKSKEEDSRRHRSREDLERERRREDQERERRHSKKDKEEGRLRGDDRSKRHGEDHVWTSREREETRVRDVKSVSAEREAEYSKEKRKREEDRGKPKSQFRLEDFRDNDGRLKGRLEDLRVSEGRLKGRLDDPRESEGRVKGRPDDLRESDSRLKGRFEEHRDSDVRGKVRSEDRRDSEGRVKIRLEEGTENDGRGSNRLEDLRDTEGRLKGRLEDLRESDGRVKPRFEDSRELDGRLKSRFEEVRESDVRIKGRFEDHRESEGRVKGRLEDPRENDGRVKGRMEDPRDSDSRVKGRLEDGRDSDGRVKRRFDDPRESDGRMKGRLDDLRENDGRVRCRMDESDGRLKGRLEDPRENDGRVIARLDDPRENDGRVKGWLDDPRDSDGRAKGRLDDLRETDGRTKGRLDDLRETDGRKQSRLDDLRETDGRTKGRLDDLRETDGRTKGRLDDVREDGRVRSRLDDQRESEGRVRGRPDDPRDSDGRVKSRLEDLRESDGRGRRHDKDDDFHAWDDRRKHEEKSRGESGHGTRNSLETRKVGDEQRTHKDKRGWEGSVTNKETTGERNGSLSGLGEDKSHRSHTDGSKKRRVEEYRTSSQFDKASTRDSDDLAATSTRHKDKKMVLQKRMEEHLTRRTQGKDLTSRQQRTSKELKALSMENGSSEDEETDRRGRSKLERWTSRKERDAITALGGHSTKKWQNSESGWEEGPSTSQQMNTERQGQSRAEQNLKEERKEEDRKEKQRLAHSGKPSALHGNSGGDAAPELQVAAPKDAAEKRKERLERLRLQAEEEAAKRQKNQDSIPQTGSVEEVKQERPARKRRWGNG